MCRILLAMDDYRLYLIFTEAALLEETLMGYSAGAYYAADSTRLLQKADFQMASLVLCYPWTTGLSADKLEKDYPPTLFILSGQDPISQKAKNYVKDM